MKILATFTDAGWDFNNIWEMPENDYPFLKWQIRNSPPADLNHTAYLMNDGTVIGEFNATDPDENSKNEDSDNSATTFDYETNAKK